MSWSDLDFTETVETTDFHGGKIIRLWLPLIDASLDSHDIDEAVGIDPGVNFGIATVVPGYGIEAWYGRLSKKPLPKNKRWEYGRLAREAIFTFLPRRSGRGISATVEGASYGAKDVRGQVGLAEARFGFCDGLKDCGYAVSIVPPQSIRARVMSKEDFKELGGMFGYWSDMNHNAADAIGAALHAAGYRGPGR